MVAYTIREYLKMGTDVHCDIIVKEPASKPVYEIFHAGMEDVMRVQSSDAMYEFIKTRGNNYDIIHVHSAIQFAMWVSKHVRGKVVFTAHGMEARQIDSWDVPYAAELTVSTKDLLKTAPERTQYIPNAPDPHYFTRTHSANRDTALLLSFNWPTFELIKGYKAIARTYQLIYDTYVLVFCKTTFKSCVFRSYFCHLHGPSLLVAIYLTKLFHMSE